MPHRPLALVLAVLGLAVVAPGVAEAQPGDDVDAPPFGAASLGAAPLGAPMFGAPSASPFGSPPEVADVSDLLPGEIAVDLRDDATDADILAMERDYGIDLQSASQYSVDVDKLELATVDPGKVAGLLARLANDARVEVAEPLVVLRASFVPNDPLYASKQWHLSRVGAPKAWEYTCGGGVTVAVVDTGVACFDKGPFARGSDLGGTRCGGGFDFVSNKPEASDDQGHGTHVAGTIAQTTNNGKGTAGLAFCADLMPIKVLNRWGWGSSAGVAQGIRWAADHGAQIINLSLGGNQPSRVLENAVKHAQKKGSLIVAAAGNSGRAVGWPAAYPGVVAVSATDSNDRIAWFSSRGPEVTIAAPGVDVTQQTICEAGRNKCEIFGTFSGTSMASPHVAGAAALVMSLGITEPQSVAEALYGSARTKDDASLYGAGVLDAAASILHAYWVRVFVRLAFLLGLGWVVRSRVKKRGGSLVGGRLFWVGALTAATGLLPIAPLLTLGSHAGRFRNFVDMLARPIGEWDMALFGAHAHRWLLFGNAGPAIGLAALLFGVRRLRPLVAGVALGSAAFLGQAALAADVAFPLGATALRAWAVGNALVCLWLARVSGNQKP